MIPSAPSHREVIEEMRQMYRAAKTKGQITSYVVKMFNGNISNEKLLSFLDLIYPPKPMEQK